MKLLLRTLIWSKKTSNHTRSDLSIPLLLLVFLLIVLLLRDFTLVLLVFAVVLVLTAIFRGGLSLGLIDLLLGAFLLLTVVPGLVRLGRLAALARLARLVRLVRRACSRTTHLCGLLLVGLAQAVELLVGLLAVRRHHAGEPDQIEPCLTIDGALMTEGQKPVATVVAAHP